MQASLSSAQVDFESLAALDAEIKSFKVGPNPYTWFTMEALEDTWRNLQKIISERDQELLKEAQRQEDNDRLRKEFARHANAFYQWLTETRYNSTFFSNLTPRLFSLWFCLNSKELEKWTFYFLNDQLIYVIAS